MKIFQIVSGINKSSGGPSYTVTSLSTWLHKKGADVELDILKNGEEDFKFDFEVKVHKRLPPKKLGLSPWMKRYLLSNAHEGDILHTNGLWMMPNIYPRSIAKRVGAKLVLSPHGMLTKWSLNHKRLQKKISGLIGQNSAILNADCIHATAESEYEDVRAFGYKGPIAIIPNGIDIPEILTRDTQNIKQRKLIFISRIHPKKGIELLIEAWSIVSRLHQGWELVICGPGDQAYIEKIRRIINESSGERISYLPPVYGKEKEKFYSDASLFVLPTHSENFGIVVAEALSFSVPVIVTKGAPWSGVIHNKCGWWINNTCNELVASLDHSLGLPEEELKAMGENGRNWMEKDFSWNEIANKTIETYRWLNEKSEKPDCIRID